MQQLVVSAALVDHKYLGAGEIDPLASHIPSASASDWTGVSQALISSGLMLNLD
jgi:hypothetical protein